MQPIMIWEASSISNKIRFQNSEWNWNSVNSFQNFFFKRHHAVYSSLCCFFNRLWGIYLYENVENIWQIISAKCTKRGRAKQAKASSKRNKENVLFIAKTSVLSFNLVHFLRKGCCTREKVPLRNFGKKRRGLEAITSMRWKGNVS